MTAIKEEPLRFAVDITEVDDLRGLFGKATRVSDGVNGGIAKIARNAFGELTDTKGVVEAIEYELGSHGLLGRTNKEGVFILYRTPDPVRGDKFVVFLNGKNRGDLN